MKKGDELAQTHCLNCGATTEGEFCQQCGQRVRDNLDRSLGQLFGEFLSNIFFLDNRFFISINYLFRFPGRMTVEFLEGKRKKFISPVTLFLFINLIYFLFNPLSDYSLALYDQVNSQPYSAWTKGWVEQKLENEGLDGSTYSITYQNASDNVSKSIMILNVPMIAIFIYLMAFKKRKYYFDSLIFTFHFFSLFMFSWVMLDWVGRLTDFSIGNEYPIIQNIVFLLFTFFLPLLYAMLSIAKFLNARWYWAVPAGMGMMLAVFIANFFYRFIIFVVTLWAT